MDEDHIYPPGYFDLQLKEAPEVRIEILVTGFGRFTPEELDDVDSNDTASQVLRKLTSTESSLVDCVIPLLVVKASVYINGLLDSSATW